jgi:hypothetical protein
MKSFPLILLALIQTGQGQISATPCGKWTNYLTGEVIGIYRPCDPQEIQCNGSCNPVFGGDSHYKWNSRTQSIKRRPSHAWAFSVAFFIGTQAFDVASSRGQMEANPILGRGTFGGRQIAIKGLLGGGFLLGEWLYTRRHPESRKAFMWANYAAGAATVGVGLSNMDKRSK